MKEKKTFPQKKGEDYDPERQNEEIDKIICSICMKKIKNIELKSFYKISYGSFIKDRFVSNKNFKYYHRDCLK